MPSEKLINNSLAVLVGCHRSGRWKRRVYKVICSVDPSRNRGRKFVSILTNCSWLKSFSPSFRLRRQPPSLERLIKWFRCKLKLIFYWLRPRTRAGEEKQRRIVNKLNLNYNSFSSPVALALSSSPSNESISLQSFVGEAQRFFPTLQTASATSSLVELVSASFRSVNSPSTVIQYWNRNWCLF